MPIEIRRRPGHAFDYSDPDEAELYLESVISAAHDRSVQSPELAAKIRDWTSYYHLTRRRGDLLRPLAAALSGDILEVGAGCGAVTRYLGETARSVTAAEGSDRRARILAARCEGLTNVDVWCDNFESCTLDGRTFDAVLSIGVIEYANKFFHGTDGFNRMLRRLGEFLNDRSLLIIAIENRLGLKYFAGAPEDHTARPYDGIEDRYAPDSVLTLGRGEWLSRLAAEGFEVLHWLYPFPDYKAPSLILSEISDGELIARHAHGVQDHPASHRFSESRVWPVLARNGLAQDLANSFLIVARRAGSQASLTLDQSIWEFDPEPTPAWKRDTHTGPSFSAQVFWKSADADYSESDSRTLRVSAAPQRQTLTFAIPSATTELRLDLADRPGVLVLQAIHLRTDAGDIAWTWDGRAASLQAAHRNELSFVVDHDRVIACMFGSDPHLILPIPPESLAIATSLELAVAWLSA